MLSNATKGTGRVDPHFSVLLLCFPHILALNFRLWLTSIIHVFFLNFGCPKAHLDSLHLHPLPPNPIILLPHEAFFPNLPEALLQPHLFPNPGALPFSPPRFSTQNIPSQTQTLNPEQNPNSLGLQEAIHPPSGDSSSSFPTPGPGSRVYKPKVCLHTGQKLFSTRLKLPGIFLESSGR